MNLKDSAGVVHRVWQRQIYDLPGRTACDAAYSTRLKDGVEWTFVRGEFVLSYAHTSETLTCLTCIASNLYEVSPP